MINQAMFQRNGRSGYVLKPQALRVYDQDLIAKQTKHFFDVTVSKCLIFTQASGSHSFSRVDHLSTTITSPQGQQRSRNHREIRR